MGKRLYDHHIAVDWSANASPKRGKDSIWISENGASGENPATRAEAMEWVRARIDRARSARERLHFGFDFAFGLTRGAGEALLGAPGWKAWWHYLAAHIEDGPRNANNRFAAAARLNAQTDVEGPFWGHPHQRSFSDLRPTRCARGADWPHPFPARRVCDTRVPGAQEIWKLAYTGSVGSQMLLGIAALHGLRESRPEVAIWPFETNFARALDAPILVTEIYPSASLWNYSRWLDTSRTVDEAQVRAVSETCARLDAAGAFEPLLDFTGTCEERDAAIREEGWILGVDAGVDAGLKLGLDADLNAGLSRD